MEHRRYRWSFPRVVLSIPLMCCDPSDLGSLVLTRIIPMERTFISSWIGNLGVRSFDMILIRISDSRSFGSWHVDQMNRWILVQSGFISSFDLPWSEWSLITDPDPDHPKGTHPWRKLHTKIQKASSETQGQIVGARESVNGREKMARRNPPVYTFLLPHYLPMGFQGCTKRRYFDKRQPTCWTWQLKQPCALCMLCFSSIHVSVLYLWFYW